MATNTKVLDTARELRKNMTKVEKILWIVLRNKKIGAKFRRQAPFVFGDNHNYVADFYCAEKKLIIELDGEIHNSDLEKEYDKFRQDIFEVSGYKVIRFKNEEIIKNLDTVLDRILHELK